MTQISKGNGFNFRLDTCKLKVNTKFRSLKNLKFKPSKNYLCPTTKSQSKQTVGIQYSSVYGNQERESDDIEFFSDDVSSITQTSQSQAQGQNQIPTIKPKGSPTQSVVEQIERAKRASESDEDSTKSAIQKLMNQNRNSVGNQIQSQSQSQTISLTQSQQSSDPHYQQQIVSQSTAESQYQSVYNNNNNIQIQQIDNPHNLINPNLAHLPDEIQGNALCWEDGVFTYDYCCTGESSQESQSQSGNPTCWDEIYSFEQCCFPGGWQEPTAANSNWKRNFSAYQIAKQSFFGCGNDFFEKLRHDAWVFFKFGEMHPRMFQSHGRSVASWAKHRSLCAPAVLITILLKLEEDLAMKPLETAFRGMLQYTSLLQSMTKSGEITEKEYRKWPLELGWNHLNSVLPRSSKHNEFLVKYQTRKRSIELVIPYCRETFEQIYDWWKVTFSRFILAHLKVTVVMKCGDNKNLRVIPQRLFNDTIQPTKFLKIVDEEVRGDECSGNFGYLEHRYDTLSDYTIFVHPDADEHIMINIDFPFEPDPNLNRAVFEADPDIKPNPQFKQVIDDLHQEWVVQRGLDRIPEQLLEPQNLPSRFLKRKYSKGDNILEATLHAALYGNIQDLGFQNLAHNRDTSDFETHATGHIFKQLFQTSLRPGIAPRSYCCSHFIVSKERVRIRSKQFYQDAKELFTTLKGYRIPPFPKALGYDIRARTLCQNMMKFWHLVFGHPMMRTPLRHRDRTVPFFLKGRNFKRQYEDE